MVEATPDYWLSAPDVVLLGPEWPERALLRAQFIEEGYNVVAIDTWPIPRLYRRTGMKPRVLVIDLHGLPDPRATLDEVRFLIPSNRVLVVTAMGTLAGSEVRRLGFKVIERPATIGEIVGAAASMLTPASTGSAASALHETNVEALTMRKQDRIASQQQSRPQQPQSTEKQTPPEKQHEQVKGGVQHDQPTRPPRPSGKLPLPD